MKMSRQRAILLAMSLAGVSTAAGAAEPQWGWSDVNASGETGRTAMLDQNPEGDAAFCGLDQKYNVIGFNQNSNELTRKVKLRLDKVAAEIGDRHCVVQLVGYASHEGGLADNALFAIERAQNSLRYLEEHGVSFAKASATGAGATNRFGASSELNRRVVITVTP